VRQIRVPFYAVQVLAVLALVGGVTVFAAVSSYTRMLLKVTKYNALRRSETQLREQYKRLETEVKNSNERLSSLQSLASEVAMTYGVARMPDTPFSLSAPANQPESAYQLSLEQFQFLMRNATAIALSGNELRTMSISEALAGRAGNLPSLWPVIGRITGSFGERLDPFNGEGSFHPGVDIAGKYGEPVRAAGDGVVIVAERRHGYGRVVVIDHGFGVTTWYAHLSAFDTQVGARVVRGEVIGFLGESGRATAPHVHYEVRIYNTPVNPWRYLHSSSRGD
jgi:murein DD-endopeptidase MepM/ murein hydrolase activator NlpD